MPEMWMGRPVRVERMSRWVNDLWPVKRRNSGFGVDIMSVVDLGYGLSWRRFDQDPRMFLRLQLC